MSKIKRRDFIKNTAVIASSVALSSSLMSLKPEDTLRTAHIGVGGMGMEDLKAMASHPAVKVTALCDVDANALENAKKLFPDAKLYTDYRVLLKELQQEIDAVVVSTPDHTHAPASMLSLIHI